MAEAEWIKTLNNPAESSKAKLAALARIAELARHEPSEAFRIFDGVAEAFEETLDEKAKAAKEMSTNLGRFHETVLLILIRATRYRLRTAQLLEFVGGNVALSLGILQQLIGCAAHEDEAIACALEILAGFARPDTYIEIEGVRPHGAGPAGSSPGNFDREGEGSVTAFSACLENFSAELLRSKLLLACVPALATRLAKGKDSSDGLGGSCGSAQLSAGQLGCARGFLRFVCCLSLLNFDDAAACAKDCAAASKAGSTLVLPLLARLVDEHKAETELVTVLQPVSKPAEDSPTLAPPTPPLLALALKAAVLLCFRAPSAVASAIRSAGVLTSLVPLLIRPGAPLRHMALLLALAINVDALAPLGRFGVHCPECEMRASEAFLGELQAALETLDADECSRLLQCVDSGIGVSGFAALPVQRDAGTCDDLGELLQQRLVSAQPAESAELLEQLQQLEAKASQLETVQAELKGLAEEQLPTMQTAFEQLALLEAELAEGEAEAEALANKLGVDLATALEGEDDLMKWERELADVALRASASLGALAAAADALVESEEDAPAKTHALRLGHNEVVEPSEQAAASAGSAARRSASERYRLLGELPQLNAGRPSKGLGKAATGVPVADGRTSRRKARRKPPNPNGGNGHQAGSGGLKLEDNVPQEFLCELNHHIMKKPVRTPEGHVFEAESIEAWLKTHNTCPVTGNRLFFEELQVHQTLKKRIQDHHIHVGLANAAISSLDNDGTL